MGLIVQKFGGSSVADADRIRNVARIITETYRRGHRVVAVLSAQGDTTDDLIAKAAEINPNASKREMDMLLSTGEQISCSLCAMAIEAMGYPVVSLTGWQAGFHTDRAYTRARIKNLDTERIESELSKNRVVVVAGFQGLNRSLGSGRFHKRFLLWATLYGPAGQKTSAPPAGGALVMDGQVRPGPPHRRGRRPRRRRRSRR